MPTSMRKAEAFIEAGGSTPRKGEVIYDQGDDLVAHAQEINLKLRAYSFLSRSDTYKK